MISTFILTHIEKYTRYSHEELEEQKELYPNRKFDKNEKPDINLTSKAKDVMFGIWANVQAKSIPFELIGFAKENPNFQLGLPRANNNIHLVLRCIWTSFDYVSS